MYSQLLTHDCLQNPSPLWASLNSKRGDDLKVDNATHRHVHKQDCFSISFSNLMFEFLNLANSLNLPHHGNHR